MNRIEDILNQLNNKERMKRIKELEIEYRNKIRKYKKLREENNYSRRKYYKKNKK